MSSYIHKPVMVAEVLAALDPQPGGCYADGTIGGGGHAAAILAASLPNGWLYGSDRDGAAVEAARTRLAEFAGRFEIRQGKFGELGDWVPAGSCDGVVLDLGVSSPQLDTAERGFSFQQEGPLDMRMDDRQPLTAADLLNTAGADELATIFWQLGGERQSRYFARAIEREHPELATSDSPTQRVGGTVAEGFASVQHRAAMLSLDNAYTADEIREFEARLARALPGERFQYVCEPKVDGLGVALLYERGRLVRGATRGDGIIGEDIKTVQFGWPLGMPLVRKLDKGLWEVRSRLPDRIARVMFTNGGGRMVLLHGFIKKSKKTPMQDLELARTRLRLLQ